MQYIDRRLIFCLLWYVLSCFHSIVCEFLRIVYSRLKICVHYQGTGSRIFSDEKLPKLHSIPSILLNLPFYCSKLSIYEANEQEKNEDKNLDLQIDFAINDKACILRVREVLRVY